MTGWWRKLEGASQQTIPAQVSFTASLNPEILPSDLQNIAENSEQWEMNMEKFRKIAVNMSRFVSLYLMFETLRVEAESTMLCEATAACTILKFAQLMRLIRLYPGREEFLVRNLAPCVSRAQRLQVLDLVKQPQGARRLRMEQANSVFFNLAVPNAR